MGKSGANERNESSLSNCRVQPALSKKEGRVDFRKNLRFKEGQAALRKNPHYKQKKANIIYNVSKHTCLHYILY